MWMETLEHNGRVRQDKTSGEYNERRKIHYRFDNDGNYTGTKEGITRKDISKK